mgnify:CR=1 FL=1
MKPFIIDKLPLNFFWIGYIKKLLPNAKFIHTTRNPMATSFSIYKTLFSEGCLDFAYDEDDIINFYDIQNYFMDFWHERYSSDILSLNYDYFTENSEQEAKKLFDLDCNTSSFRETPGVTSSVTPRFTMVLVVFGSSNWSQMATRNPAFTSLGK